MPMPRGKKKLTKAETFDELRHGRTYRRTARKEGGKAANRQMVAIALRYGKAHGFKKRVPGERAALHKARHKRAARRSRRR